jgi:SAM-dependent methyltransferase
MNKLSKKEYWDSVYKDLKNNSGKIPKKFSFRNWFKWQTRDYSNFLIWEDIFPKYLPKETSLKIIEIGCAPGKYLINFKNKFGYEPYGIEYSTEGVNVTKQNIANAGANPDNIIEADFFDDNFQKDYQESFDLVFSRGFIEHFNDVSCVISKHLTLVKKGGYVIISIPNISGLNKVFAKFLNYDSFLIHNTSIMNLKVFAELFPKNEIESLYCDYVGLFSFGLFNTNKKWKYYLHRILLILQRTFDFFLRLFLKDNILKNQFSSPYLLFIGKKKC